MKRRILHWTAGTNFPNTTDLRHYHYVIDKGGKITEGFFLVSTNEVCKSYNNKALYAAHTGGGNTGSIGVAVCGMADYKGKLSDTKFPLTAVQVERMFSFTAELCKKYGIPVTPDTVLTHYEFGKSHPNTSSFGKIDITILPPYLSVKPTEVGDFIRKKVKWYLKNSK